MNNYSTKYLSEKLVEAVREEPFISKEILAPKFKSLIESYRLKLSANNYNKIKSPAETAKLIRSIELNNLEKVFWMNKLKEKIGEDNIQEYYDELDIKRSIWKGELI